jgi:hypothetical protein
MRLCHPFFFVIRHFTSFTYFLQLKDRHRAKWEETARMQVMRMRDINTLVEFMRSSIPGQ